MIRENKNAIIFFVMILVFFWGDIMVIGYIMVGNYAYGDIMWNLWDVGEMEITIISYIILAWKWKKIGFGLW